MIIRGTIHKVHRYPSALRRATTFAGFLVVLAAVIASGSAGPGATLGADPKPPGKARAAPTPSLAPGSELAPAATVAPVTPTTTTTTTTTSTRYQEASSAISYGGFWARAFHAGFSGGAVRWSRSRGASATFRFTGTTVTWYGPKGPTRGKAKIYLDGVYKRTVDLYASQFAASRAVYSATFSTQKARQLKIVVLQTAGRPMVAIDAFVVRRTVTMTDGAQQPPPPAPAPTPTPPPAPTPTPTPTPTPPPAPTPPPVTGGYPADTTLKYLATTSLSRPALLAPLLDPILGTRTTRITDTAGVRHAYSRISAWNSDGSRILLGFSYPGRMLDGRTYQDLGAFRQVSQAVWSNVDPNKLYGAIENAFYSQSATTGALTKLRTFSAYMTLTIGDYEGGISDDDRYVALIGTTSTGARHLITYDIAANSVVADSLVSSRINNAQISRKGTYVVVVNDTDGTAKGQGVERYTRDLSSRINLTPYGRHGDNALDAAGNEIYVSNNAPNVVAFNLATGAAKRLLSGTTAFEYGHVSGRNIKRPGWIYLSVFNNSITAGRPGHDQLVAVKTDGSGTVEVFGFSHHTNTTVYAMQPQGVPSPDGTRVLFASEWGTSSTYTFVAGR